MARALEYPDGTFCWTELQTRDPERAGTFYAELLGWELREEGGGTIGTIDGLPVAGLRVAGPGQPIGWRHHVAGGSSRSGECVVDPAGAELWIGAPLVAELVNEPGTWTWTELGATDLDAQASFWAARFGWRSERASEPIERATFWLGKLLVAGAHLVRSGEPVGWQATFRVTDVDATAATAERLGGRVLVSPMDIPIGRLALVADPDGATLSVSSFEAPFGGVDGS